MEKKTKKPIPLSEIINFILTVALIVAIILAIQQGAFEKKKCTTYCRNLVPTVFTEIGQETVLCQVNWDKIENSSKYLEVTNDE